MKLGFYAYLTPIYGGMEQFIPLYVADIIYWRQINENNGNNIWLIF